MIIAIDGPAASGKGTISKGIANHYNLPHLDTGLLYRAVGYAMLDKEKNEDFEQVALDFALSLDKSNLDPNILGSLEVANAAAKVAKIEKVRLALRDYQTAFAKQQGGAILDGRDIGTKICPNADVKLFITAKPQVRARRRSLQLLAKGGDVSESDILSQIIARDESDRANKAGNFYKADDAHLLDTSKLDIEAALREAITIVDEVMATKSE